jgi:hypothetical protein
VGCTFRFALSDEINPMISIFRNRLTVIWVLLVLATLVSFDGARLGENEGAYFLATSVVFVIAFLKVRFIGLEFMELRHAPLLLRLGFEIWTVAVCVAILGFYWVGLA